MTEEIIIDGVNVAGCGVYKDKHCKDKTSIMFCDTNLCSNYPYCYYKQLKRLEQERDELKKACEKCKLFDIEKTNRDLLEQIEKLEQENKELNFKINQLKANSLYNDLTGIEFSAKVFELKQENKQMKSALEEIREVLKLYANSWVDGKIYPNLHYDNTKAKEGLLKINEVLK